MNGTTVRFGPMEDCRTNSVFIILCYVDLHSTIKTGGLPVRSTLNISKQRETKQSERLEIARQPGDRDSLVP